MTKTSWSWTNRRESRRIPRSDGRDQRWWGGLLRAGFRISTSGAAERQGVVPRLDAGTSGLMVVAKSERAYTELKRQFHDREVTKIYHTVVQGHPDPLRG